MSEHELQAYRWALYMIGAAGALVCLLPCLIVWIHYRADRAVSREKAKDAAKGERS